MPFATQAQGLDAQQQLLCGEWIHRRPQVPQDLHAHPDRKSDWPKSIPELQSMVAFRGVVELREALGVLAPVEFTAVDDDAADGSTVPTDPLGCRVYHYVSTVVYRATKIATSAEGVIDLELASARPSAVSFQCNSDTYDYGNPGVMRHLAYSLKVWDVVSWVSDALQIYHLGLVVDQMLEIFRLVPIDEFGMDPQPGQENLELIVGPPVQIRSGYDVVAGMCECDNRHELSRLSRGCCHGGDAAFQRCDALLNHIHRGLRGLLTYHGHPSPSGRWVSSRS